MDTFDDKMMFEGEILAAEVKRRQELLFASKKSLSPFRPMLLEYVIVIILVGLALDHVFGKYTDSIWIGLVAYVVVTIQRHALTLHKRLDALIALLGDERLLSKFGKETKDNA